LAKGAFWGGIASVMTRIIALLGSFALARILGQNGFGEYGVINSTSAMVGGMAGMGIGATVIKHVAELRDKDPARAGRILALSTLVTTASAVLYGGAFVFFAPWLAEKTLAAPHLAPMLQISSVTLALGLVNGVQGASLTGCESFRVLSYVNIIQSLALSTFVLIGAWLWGITGAVVMVAVSMALTVSVTRWFVSKEWRRFGIILKWNEAWKEWRVLLDYSLPSFLSGLSLGPVMWGCSALLANQPDGYAQLGIYNAANQWQVAIQFLPSLIGSALLPIMSERHGSGDAEGCVRVMKKMMVVVAGIVVPVSLVISLVSPWIMRGYGESFVSGFGTLCLSVVAAALVAIMAPVGQYIGAIGRMWVGFWMNTGWGLCMLVASWLMVKWGAEGLAGARLIAYLAHSIWVFTFVMYQKRGR
jgi:O-antigen/teichoic acid export membrane protein